MKYKNIILALFLASSSLLALLLPLQTAHAADAQCYVEIGALQVAGPAPCGAASGITFQSLSGGFTASPLADKCYVRLIQQTPGGIVYTENNCADLQAISVPTSTQHGCEGAGGAWTNGGPATNGFYCKFSQYGNADESAQCAASGGTWKSSRSENTTTYSCDCSSQSGAVAVANVCVVQSGDTPGVSSGGDLAVDGSGDKILSLLQDGINLLTAVAGLAITGMVIVGGIQYSSAGGNPQAAAAAKKKISNAALAMLTLVFIFTFLQWLVPGGIFG